MTKMPSTLVLRHFFARYVIEPVVVDAEECTVPSALILILHGSHELSHLLIIMHSNMM